MKLRTKIQLFSSLFMLILVLLINTSVYYLFYKTSADTELDQLAIQTNTMVETINANPNIPKKELLHAFLPADGMIRIYSEADSKPLLTVTKLTDYRELPGEFSRIESRAIMKNADNNSIAVISKPIIWDEGEVVSLQVSEHSALNETMKTLFYVLVVASILMVIPTIIAGFVLGRFLLRPINALIQTMQDNTKYAKWEKIDIENRSHDEIYEMGMTFNDMIDQIKENFEKQEIFVSDASHELKTPISIVKSYAQLLERRGQDNPELFKESVEAIDSEADRMQKLVEQMLLLAKSEYVPHNERRVNMTELCEETVHTFKGAYDRLIHLEIPLQSEIYVMGNKDQLHQVLYILMNNAIKYSEDAITLTLTKENQHVHIRVSDNGQGISEKDQQRIFDRFYRIDKARSRDTGGTGLGLPIAKSIIENHQGHISVMSQLSEGTTFLLELPIRENPQIVR